MNQLNLPIAYGAITSGARVECVSGCWTEIDPSWPGYI